MIVYSVYESWVHVKDAMLVCFNVECLFLAAISLSDISTLMLHGVHSGCCCSHVMHLSNISTAFL